MGRNSINKWIKVPLQSCEHPDPTNILRASYQGLNLRKVVVFGDSFPYTEPGHGDFEGFNIVRPVTKNSIVDIDASKYYAWEMIPEIGVSKECLIILDNWAFRVNQNMYMSLCPKAQFGALLVDFTDHSGSVVDSFNRPCGRILSTNRGVKTTTDPTEHSEIDAIRRFGYHNPGQRSNSTLWRPLAIFTPGASCPMDTAAEIWTGVHWQIYSLSIADLIALNFSQIAVEPEEQMTRSGMIANKLGLVRYVNRPQNVARFGHRNIISNPCLPGCSRVTPTDICTDDRPYVLEPSKLIPDVNYYIVPEDFQLVPNAPTSAPTSAPTPTPTRHGGH